MTDGAGSDEETDFVLMKLCRTLETPRQILGHRLASGVIVGGSFVRLDVRRVVGKTT